MLIEAANKGDVQKCIDAIQNGGDVNGQDTVSYMGLMLGFVLKRKGC